MASVSRILLLSSLVAIVVPATLPAQSAASRPVRFRLMVGSAVPVTPAEFRADWNLGPNASVSVGYAVSARMELALGVEYASFGAEGVVPSPPPTVTPRHATSLWAAWVQSAFMMSTGRLRPRAYAGAGVVAHGAARTAFGLQAGIGIERSLGDRLAGYLDASFAHAFTADPSRPAGITKNLSYAPIRIGLAWR